jgi:hypothetical protein
MNQTTRKRRYDARRRDLRAGVDAGATAAGAVLG